MQCNDVGKIVAIIYTQWELCGLLSYLSALFEKGGAPDVEAIVCRLPGRTDFLVPQVNYPKYNLTVRHYDVVDPEKVDTAGLLCRMKERYEGGVGAELLISPDYLPLESAQMFKTITCHAMWKLGTARPKAVALDDGVGVHLFEDRSSGVVVRIDEPGLLNGVLLTSLMRGHDGPWGWFPLEMSGVDTFRARDDVVESYRKIFDGDYWKMLDPRSRKRKNYETIKELNSVIFASQPVVVSGLMTADEYVEIIQEARTYCKANGYEMVVKVHPFDDMRIIKRAGVPYIKDKIVLEAATSLLDPPAVIGLYNTGLVYSSLISGVPSRSLVEVLRHPALERIASTEPYVKFKKLFSQFVDF